jgi:hypothetical protein
MPVRDAHRGRIFDVDHRRFVREPMSVVHELYDYFGLRLSQETESRMLARVRANPERKHGEHRYHLETFGLNEAEIIERYGEYMANFNLIDQAEHRPEDCKCA